MLAAIVLSAASFTRIPPPSDADLRAASFGSRNFSVGFRGSSLEVRLRDNNVRVPFRPDVMTATLGYYGTQPSEVLHVRNAWFLAFYHGEFGGALWQFDADGTAGQQLLGAPAYDLASYRGEVLAATGSAAPFFLKPLRIYRYAFDDGTWREAGHADFPFNIVDLTNLNGGLYGIATIGNDTETLVQIHLDGTYASLWRGPRNLSVSSIAIDGHGNFALGARGYIVMLQKRGSTYGSQWYAPRDCVRYTPNADQSQAIDARCIGARGSKAYAHKSNLPANDIIGTRDGLWMLARRPQHLLHFTHRAWSEVPLPRGDMYFWGIDDPRGVPVLSSQNSLWQLRESQWSQIGTNVDCTSRFSIRADMAWCGNQQKSDSRITGMHFDGATVNAIVRGPVQPELIVAGNAGDAWFTSRDQPFLGHVLPDGNVDDLKVSAPVAELSVGDSAVWFTETDQRHYGYADQHGELHEFTWRAGFPVRGILAGRGGAWLEESFIGRTMLRRLKSDGSEDGVYLFDIRSALETRDGTVYTNSAVWPTILRLTPEQRLSRFRLPCAEPYLQLIPAPDDGVWFISSDPGCSGLIQGGTIIVRDPPVIQTVVYK